MRPAFSTAFAIVYTDNVERSLRFYRDLLGFEVTYQFPPDGEPGYAALALGSHRLGIGMPPEHVQVPTDRGRSVEICVYTSDVDTAVEFLRQNGVRVRAEPADQPWGERNAYVEDPDGNPVHIASK
jgi:lactoylglutathione lyase